MKKVKIYTKLNYDPNDFPGEVNTLPSKTTPDQSYSLREILRRSAAGVPPVGIAVHDEYDDQNDLDIDKPVITGDYDLADAFQDSIEIEQKLNEESTSVS
jgi:hypothetical protein